MNVSSWRMVIAEFPERTVPSPLAQCNARYRTARQFTSIKFAGMGADASEGYSLLMKVSLSYSALESLEATFVSSHGAKRDFIALPNQSLANEFRGLYFAKLMDDLRSTITANAIQRNFDAIRNADSDDVRPIAQAIRNAFFHPRVTPSGLNLSSATRKNALYQLSRVVIESVDNSFTERWQRYLEGELIIQSVRDGKTT
jgi:hypothetical protein